MEGGEWKVEVEAGCPPWASVLDSVTNCNALTIFLFAGDIATTH